MNESKIVEMAKLAGLEDWTDDGNWRGVTCDLKRFAALVAAAVKEEDARICEENIAGISYGRGNHGPCLSPFDKEGGGRHDGMTYAAAIRVSIKEGK